ncbi:DUF2630 family protein [Nocardia callitridis]|uniref:DUF2630 family protein n=1 Tax=Nocardia callitridis TaxID=648753 RepID=A0ABP9JTF2_9NOCA
MTEHDVLTRIQDLVDQEHRLREQTTNGQLDPQTERQRLAEIEVLLDQAWDLLRQRRARLDSGEPAEAAQSNPAAQVEGYLQ